ncbi:MAG: co-chaperone DjlA [Hahellaceae bacterium]|nr:co-chaperone DjlA [Hahellaceae bacterium]MCP5210223.1 co-chaperone DjlA [Hahellaceae bacterium]
MSWWGKVLGGAFGFAAGGPLGALLGAALGHSFDKGVNQSSLGWDEGSQERIQTSFFTATFSVMGHIAKADGKVTRDEIKLAEEIIRQMNLNDEQAKAAKALFGEGKADDFDLLSVVNQFRQECHRRVNLIRMFLEIQIGTALADGELHPTEHHILQIISENLGIGRFDFDRILAMVIAQRRFTADGFRQSSAGVPPTRDHLKEAYQALGVSPQVSDAEVKKAYRRLLSQHHPDKLVAKGLPEEMMKLANEKTHEIRAAYELIMKARKD